MPLLKIIPLAILIGAYFSANAQVYTDPSTGKVGIGTTTPQTKLHVVGQTLLETNDDDIFTFNNTDNSWQYIQFKRSNVRQAWMGLDGGNDFVINKEVVGNIVFQPQNGNVQVAPNGGNVGVGTNNPLDKLHVNGRARFDANYDNGNLGGTIVLSHTGKTANGTAKDWVLYNMSGIYGNSLQFWAYDAVGCPNGLCAPRFTILDNGNVGIGTTVPKAKLAVMGDILAQKVKVTLNGWPDYVFNTSYRLRPLNEVERYIKQYHHLPEVPDAEEIEKEGLDLGDNQAVLLKKIEELTLYLIQQNKKLEAQNRQLKEQQNILKQQQQEIETLKKQVQKS